MFDVNHALDIHEFNKTECLGTHQPEILSSFMKTVLEDGRHTSYAKRIAYLQAQNDADLAEGEKLLTDFRAEIQQCQQDLYK